MVMSKMQVDLHLSPAKLLKSLKAKPEDFGEIALLCGQRHRVDICLKYLEDVKKNFTFAGHDFFTGIYNGKKVTVGDSGMYADNTAMLVDMLCSANIPQFLRLGSCGSLSSDIEIGDVIVAESAIRGEGVTQYYVDDDFVAVADQGINQKLLSLIDAHCGAIWSMGAIFREKPEIVDPIIEQGAIAVDMVTSVVLTLAQLNKVKASAILAVSDSVITGKHGFSSPIFKQTEEKIVQTAFNYINIL